MLRASLAALTALAACASPGSNLAPTDTDRIAGVVPALLLVSSGAVAVAGAMVAFAAIGGGKPSTCTRQRRVRAIERKQVLERTGGSRVAFADGVHEHTHTVEKLLFGLGVVPEQNVGTAQADPRGATCPVLRRRVVVGSRDQIGKERSGCFGAVEF